MSVTRYRYDPFTFSAGLVGIQKFAGGYVSEFGGDEFQYQDYGTDKRLNRIGSNFVKYNGNRISHVDYKEVYYDQKNRDHLSFIGDFKVIYKQNSHEIESIGGRKVVYFFPCIYNSLTLNPTRDVSNGQYYNNQEEKLAVDREKERITRVAIDDKRIANSIDKRERNAIEILGHLTDICTASEFWRTRVRNGTTVTSSSGEVFVLPVGVAYIHNYLVGRSSHLKLSSQSYRLECICMTVAERYAANFGCFHSFFHGRSIDK